ncbi:30S ribosomal protein S8 [Candidatus Termititenax spirochaetophilus]|uniref:Small ribosomal subunit protein uS8 n=1 Tax=Candidatus Termititenax spirochaetophilus TaxID=2218522 RepID=A0A388T7P2_9BACT|nr:30S ribosomal protein S8 [Candidatus Termititenax spirochaetophilus]
MGTTDSLGDMITIIRNGSSVGFKQVELPFSKLRQAVLGVMKREGFINEVESYQKEGTPHYFLRVTLKYGPAGEKVLNHIERISKPGRRVYLPKNKIPRVRNGFGTIVLTTPKGVLSGKEARLKKIGGEAICRMW